MDDFESALVVRRWTTCVSSVKDQHDKVPVWVKIFNVPLEYWNGVGLSHIAWEIGKPLDVDSHTANMCQNHWGRPAFMRVLIEMSAAKDWLNEIQVYSSDLTTGERIISNCKVEYAWNPSKCSHYKVYGHKDFNCGILIAKQKKEEEERNKLEKGKEGVTIDLMQELLSSTKEVKEQNDGFVDVMKKNKGNKGNFVSKEATGGKSHFSNQGQQGNLSKNEGSGAFAGNRMQGQKGNNQKIGNSGAYAGNRYQGYYGNNQEKSEFNFDRGGKTGGKKGQGYNGNIQSMKGKPNVSKIEQRQSWKNNKVMGKSKDGGMLRKSKVLWGIILCVGLARML